MHNCLLLSIIAAIDEFHELQKELSHISRRSSGMAPEKLEQGEASENDFNLSNFLHGISDDRKEAGHQLKHLGVIWKDLSVEVCDTKKLASCMCATNITIYICCYRDWGLKRLLYPR